MSLTFLHHEAPWLNIFKHLFESYHIGTWILICLSLVTYNNGQWKEYIVLKYIAAVSCTVTILIVLPSYLVEEDLSMSYKNQGKPEVTWMTFPPWVLWEGPRLIPKHNRLGSPTSGTLPLDHWCQIIWLLVYVTRLVYSF